MSEGSENPRSLLEEISIRGLGVIDSAEVAFKPGLNVITGETGAGKTMLLTALSLVLGAKSDTDLVRNGSERLTVSGRFKLPKKPTEKFGTLLDEHDPEIEDGAILLARTVSKDGKSRALISGGATTASILSEFGEELIEIHGQHGTLSLTKPGRQRQLLDSFGGDSLSSALRQYQNALAEFQNLRNTLDELRKSAKDRESKLVQLEDLSSTYLKLKPISGELGELDSLISKLDSVEELRLAATSALIGMENEDGGALSALGSAKRAMGQARGKDGVLDEIASKIEDIHYQIADIGAELNSYLDRLEADPDLLARSLDRRALLNSFAKRFGQGEDRIDTFEDAVRNGIEAKKRMDDLAGGDERLQELTEKSTKLFGALREFDKELSDARLKSALVFERSVIEELRELAMPNAEFKCRVVPSELSEGSLSNFGSAEVELLFSAHSGGTLLPIAKAASGGELSRLMLAIEVVLSKGTRLGTYLFDEIDAGIGGKAALEVGRRLKQLSKNAQVIVVTHLPQVAIWADHHLRVLKDERGSVTQSSINVIEGSQREGEIARMLSGLAESEHAQEHARELLNIGRS